MRAVEWGDNTRSTNMFFIYKLNLLYLVHCLLECSAMSETWEGSAMVKLIHVEHLHTNTMECVMEKAKCVICNENSTEKPLEMIPELYFMNLIVFFH